MLKVLWITSGIMPEAQMALFPNTKVAGSGGWISSLLEDLAYSRLVNISVLSFSPKIKTFHMVKGKYAEYYLYPHRGFMSPSKYDPIVSHINSIVNPDLVHIHGAEFPYGLSFVNTNGNHNVVVSIQGLISVIASHYTDGLTKRDILRNITIRDVFLGSILSEKKNFRKRGAIEIELLSKVNNIIGRTEFDYAHAICINPLASYWRCGEILRSGFYNQRWQYDNCVKHRIYVSQSNYPVKGLHQLLRAIALVKRSFPDVSLHIAGADITKCDSLSDIKSYSGYGKIINKIIKKYDIVDNVSFTGFLSASGVVKELLEANLFVCPSSIENSSNSVAEAQCLGVPCLASFVGGIPSLIPTPEMGQMYNFFDIEVLSKKICDCFVNSPLFDNTIVVSEARKRHDKPSITKTLLSIYNAIVDK